MKNKTKIKYLRIIVTSILIGISTISINAQSIIELPKIQPGDWVKSESGYYHQVDSIIDANSWIEGSLMNSTKRYGKVVFLPPELEPLSNSEKVSYFLTGNANISKGLKNNPWHLPIQKVINFENYERVDDTQDLAYVLFIIIGVIVILVLTITFKLKGFDIWSIVSLIVGSSVVMLLIIFTPFKNVSENERAFVILWSLSPVAFSVILSWGISNFIIKAKQKQKTNSKN